MEQEQDICDIHRVDVVRDLMLTPAHEVKHLEVLSHEEELSYLEDVVRYLDGGRVEPSQQQLKKIHAADALYLDCGVGHVFHFGDHGSQRLGPYCKDALVYFEQSLLVDQDLEVGAYLFIID